MVMRARLRPIIHRLIDTRLVTTPPLRLERSLSIGITSQFQENKYLRLAIQQSEAIKRKGGFYKDASKSLQSSKFYFGVKTLKTRASSVSSL
jgi:hypothetical protein